MASISRKSVRALMRKAGTGFLATTDGRRASLRPMATCAWVGRELWMATSGKSAKVADIRRRPRVEICHMAGDLTHVRIAGACRVSANPADKRRMFGAFKWMKNYFGSPTAPGWVVLRLKPDSIRVMGADLQYRRVR